MKVARILDASWASTSVLCHASAESVAVRPADRTLRAQTQRPIRRRGSSHQKAALHIRKVMQVAVRAGQRSKQRRVGRTSIHTNRPILDTLLRQQGLHGRISVATTRVSSSNDGDQLTFQSRRRHVLRPEAIHGLSDASRKIDISSRSRMRVKQNAKIVTRNNLRSKLEEKMSIFVLDPHTQLPNLLQVESIVGRPSTTPDPSELGRRIVCLVDQSLHKGLDVQKVRSRKRALLVNHKHHFDGVRAIRHRA